MLDIMNQAKNAIEAYNEALQVSSANIANLTTTGYKSIDVSFQSIFEKLVNSGSASDSFSDLGGTNPFQLGQGMAIGNASINLTDGTLAAGNSIDLAIRGQGLFIVSPDNGNTYYYTRNGDFTRDANGFITSNGMPVYGFLNGGSTPVPIQLSSAQTDTSQVSWSTAGVLQYAGASTGYQIALTYFPNSSGLQQAIGTSFMQTGASGSPVTPAVPGGAYGTVTPSNLEGSNVSYLTETIKALELQRNINANLTMLRAASDIISSFINKLG